MCGCCLLIAIDGFNTNGYALRDGNKHLCWVGCAVSIFKASIGSSCFFAPIVTNNYCRNLDDASEDLGDSVASGAFIEGIAIKQSLRNGLWSCVVSGVGTI
jgi:hypothetical protein